jgi:hypothetical protein
MPILADLLLRSVPLCVLLQMHYSLQLGGFTVTAYHVALFILATYVPGAPYMYSHMVTVSVVVYSALYSVS